ncbi:MAG: MgtC/SapB family protein [Kofleriaceae bacterium]|nr:MgtC/SapB family protein [Kofleriaceae bacterium]
MWFGTWAQTLETVVSIVAAYVLALPLAFEREVRGRAGPGLRTMPLVSVGACGYLLISRFLYERGVYDADGLFRTLRSVMTGIGFIGGGVILKGTRDVRGLATGAAVWMSGALGAAVGLGYYEIAVVLGLANVLVLEIQRRLARLARARSREA